MADLIHRPRTRQLKIRDSIVVTIEEPEEGTKVAIPLEASFPFTITRLLGKTDTGTVILTIEDETGTPATLATLNAADAAGESVAVDEYIPLESVLFLELGTVASNPTILWAQIDIIREDLPTENPV